ncbi:MAG: hypothetical protein PHT07_20655 [Paludibacter sp.]|nr:hypothetical protein [Paludibacter sp.]
MAGVINSYAKSGEVKSAAPLNATTTSTGDWTLKDSPSTTIQAIVVGTGTVTATIVIDCSNDGIYACTTPLASIGLNGTTSSSDGFTTNAPWKYFRYRVTAISGTGATVNVNYGV